MSKRDWKLFVEDILECIGKIEKYIEGMKFEDFENDDKTTDAVVRNLEIIGEASKNIPDIRMLLLNPEILLPEWCYDRLSLTFTLVW